MSSALLLATACEDPGGPTNDLAPTTPGVDEPVPTVDDVSVSNPYEPANTMMYAVSVTVSDHNPDANHDATVGYAPRGTDCATGSWTFGSSKRFETEDTLSWMLYGFQPGAAYDYKVQVGAGAAAETRCGELGTPELPPALAALHLTYTKGDYATRYVLLDTDDCGASTDDESAVARAYIIALDPDTEKIVWYLDVAARSPLGGTNLTGWRYQPGTPDRFLATVDKRYLYEWDWDGTVLAAKDVAGDACDGSDAQGPCIHHDAFWSEFSGKTYVISSEQSALDGIGTAWDVCGDASKFLDDGYQVWDPDLSASETKGLMRDYAYDPATDEGPNTAPGGERKGSCDASLWSNYFDPYATIDWTHVNSIAASSFDGTEVLDLSLKGWDQVLRFDEAGKILWRLSPHPLYSDWALQIVSGIPGPASFEGQHDVHFIAADTLLMFDNTGDEDGSRVLRIQMDRALQVATIDRSWAVVDSDGNALACTVEGSAQPVPGTDAANMLTICNDTHSVIELDDSSGNTGVPPLTISIPDEGFCTEGGPERSTAIHGWYRTFPVDDLGDF